LSVSLDNPLPKLGTSAGARLPLGATVQDDGVNFAVFSPRATRVWLRLYHGATDAKPIAELELDAATHRTYGFWHVFVAGARAGWFYTWRADGPNEPAAGLGFDARRELLDPWARLVSDAVWDREAAIDGDPAARRAELAAADDSDWGGDEPLRRPLHETVIYELHVAGYTRHPSAGVESPGTFQGLVEKIPHLKSLGITDVELLPVFAFDEQDVPAATAALGLRNFWGSSPVSFFAPHGPFAATGDPRREFRDMVKALHTAGIGVILDVVLNHTAEGSAEGPTIGYKGLVNGSLIARREHRSKYLDFTGCGNTGSSNQRSWRNGRRNPPVLGR
jgi:glycogen operon protein